MMIIDRLNRDQAISEILRIREAVFAAEDTVCLERARLLVEAYCAYRDDPPPLKQAKTLAHVLGHMTLDMASTPFFGGNTSSRPRALMLLPEYGFGLPAQIVHENPKLAGILDNAIPQDLLDFWNEKGFGVESGIGHLAVDMGRVVHEGLAAMVAEARSLAGEGDQRARVYRQAMVIALQAVIDWASRYADAAERAAEMETDPLIRAAHRRVAAACRRVPAYPSRCLFEGLQAMLLVHLAIHIEGHGFSVSIGLPDRVLAPFIKDDFDAGEATALVAAFLLKIHMNSVFGRGSKTQAITVGGVDHSGEDRCNVLTRCFLDAFDLVRVGDPHLFLRWHAAIDPDIKRRAIEMLASGVSMPLLVHDLPTAGGFVEAGVEKPDAWEYCVIGCNELGIPGRLAESATATGGTIQYLALLNGVLLSHPNPADITSMSALLALLEACVADHALAERERGLAYRRRVAETMPTPFTTALMRGCIERGEDFMTGMQIHLPNIYERGLTNAINALAAIEQVVFTERAATLTELIAALHGNFEGAAPLLARLRAAPKWGNDNAVVDRYAVLLLAMRERVLNEVDARVGSRPHTVCHVVRSLHYFDGRGIAASPDGRLAGTPVADSIGIHPGTALAGPTGILNSVLKLDAGHYYKGGTNLNLTLPATRWRRPEMQAALLALVETFFAGGGQELQLAILDARALRDAQAHPERYGDLLVRVAGFNTRFVDLALVEQEELIARAEAV
jgi:pyruvate-formate lyase